MRESKKFKNDKKVAAEIDKVFEETCKQKQLEAEVDALFDNACKKRRPKKQDEKTSVATKNKPEEWVWQLNQEFLEARLGFFVPGHPPGVRNAQFSTLKEAVLKARLLKNCTAITKTKDGVYELRGGKELLKSHFASEISWLKKSFFHPLFF